MEAIFGLVFILGVLFVAILMLAVFYVKIYNEICQPNEVLVFSGARSSVIHSGSKNRIPLLQKVDRIDITNMVIDINVGNAYSKGGIALNIKGVANVKIGSHKPYIDNAIERFLGMERSEILQIAKETLEGNMRGVLATLTPEEINDDRMKFAESLQGEAEQDLRRLGMILDNLKIQSVSDDKQYLNSIGRKQSADLIMRSRVSESQNQADAKEREAANQLRTAIAKINTKKQIARADAERRMIDAKTRGEAMAAEERSKVASAIAKAKAGIEVQRARIEQTKRQLDADVVQPAGAYKEQLQAEAIGSAAKTIEDGRATAEALRALVRTWQQAASYDQARQLFLTQQFDLIVDQLLSTINDIKIDKITVIDSKMKGVDQSGSIPMKALSGAAQVKETMGIDVPDLINSLSALTGKK